MADEDEIDILGDFSFNSCFALNNQGIPSCSNREDTVHPQWLLDSTATNWYDFQGVDSTKDGHSKKLIGTSTNQHHSSDLHTTWSQSERELLMEEMAKYGRDPRKISQVIKTKTEAEIQALIEAEHGINLDIPSCGLDKHEDQEDVPTVVQEEVVADDTLSNNILYRITTGSPTIPIPKKHPFRKKNFNTKSKNSLLKPDILSAKSDVQINPSEIFYDDDLVVGSTESIGSDMELSDIVSKNIVKYQGTVKTMKKIGNHRRKQSKSDKKMKNKNTDFMKSPARQRKDSNKSDESTKSTKLQIVLGSGLALPISEGEEVIKIEKKKDSEPESDIEIDIDSDNEDNSKNKSEMPVVHKETLDEAPIAVPLRKFEPMPRRKKKINLDGGGGYTIMHTDSGDLYEVSSEPRKERQPRKQPIHLIQCKIYNAERPAPFSVEMGVSVLIAMDWHAHSSRAEVMGLVGGALQGARRALRLALYRAAAALAAGTHCDMDPVSQAGAAAALAARGARVSAWHHSHPRFACRPSARDLRSQRALQQALERGAPLLALITSQHWPAGRAASQYRCIRVEEDDFDPESPVGYQFSVKLLPDLTLTGIPTFLEELQGILFDQDRNEYSIDMVSDVCPQAKMTYLNKCISSISHHMRSAGYEDNDPVVKQLIQGIRDIFR